jgi:hypothetical protein
MSYIEGSLDLDAVDGDGGELGDSRVDEDVPAAFEVDVILIRFEALGECRLHLCRVDALLLHNPSPALLELRHLRTVLIDILHVVPPLFGVQFKRDFLPDLLVEDESAGGCLLVDEVVGAVLLVEVAVLLLAVGRAGDVRVNYCEVYLLLY